MNSAVAFPAIACMVLAVVAGYRPLRIHPERSARLLVTAMVVSVIAVTASVTATAAAFLLEGAPHDASHPRALAALAGHRPVNEAVGVACVAAGVLMAAAAARAAWRVRHERRWMRAAAKGLNASHDAIALAIPGRRGGVVLSQGLRTTLPRAELQVVIAHEQAHLRHRHHRYLAASSICAATIPLLRWTDRSLRFAIERWADEEVAVKVCDRQLVAQTIARVALPSVGATVTPALSEFGVVARVEALLEDAPPASRGAGAAMLTAASIAGSGVTSSAVQLHHLGVI
jgi:hypothetical protein